MEHSWLVFQRVTFLKKNERMSCFIELPKELISHIFTFVFLHHYQTKYKPHYGYISACIAEICDHIDPFITDCQSSRMGTYMRSISHIHPKITKIIKSMCKWNERGWYFKKSFFIKK